MFITKLIILVTLVILYFWGKRKLARLSKEEKKSLFIKVAIFVVLAFCVLGSLTGKMHPLGLLFASLIAFLRFGMSTIYQFLPFLLTQSGGKASFKTEHLDVKINVFNRSISGTIIKGLHEGKSLENLDDLQIEELSDYYQSRDSKSYYLIKFCHNRGFTEQTQNTAPPPSFSDPSREEALMILGLTGEPSRKEITTAHKKLINRVHPDKGGNDFLASRINQARDTLLKNINH